MYRATQGLNMMVITPSEYEVIADMNAFARQHLADHVCVERHDKVRFFHVTSVHNKDFVEVNGICTLDDGIEMNMGNGVYAICTNDPVGLHSLQESYIEETFVEDGIQTLLFVVGEFEGDYLEGVYNYHKGYLLLKTKQVPPSHIEYIGEYSVNKFQHAGTFQEIYEREAILCPKNMVRV